MSSTSRQNLETVLIDFLGALWRADVEAATELLDPDVTWQGGSRRPRTDPLPT